ncbi:IS1182 family transposase [Fluviicola taffensis]|uniref:Transposase IS4 family protein n=1 Tax=Fluviicola taffensis (strain DSM 16823 / NCIMB 13979 / RW262) TaxID=755732 RepID=F2IEU2_FLUTR|nr:IS1182 family transposase [Fluviicola taffensis]AEA45659.1 transposase IS4 family protein [Fluviicola taffensis DSM 16823]AEA45677.1 transposase IS4 family protein [Fluviicola taffensis DSM 16823]AEA45745.1 transposase IS4 family protein [Fluviicola taffensis DSM 16823]
MKFIQGKDRNQTEFFCLDQAVSEDNEVRLIDLFVGAIKLSDYGFDMSFIENGRPAYHPADLLKLFIYGYLNRVRSSRQLEKECKRNIELMWLMKGLAPDHNTIANFRKDNPRAIRKVFHATVSLAKNFELIGGKLLAGDGTKLRAQNSKKNNFNEKKIERHIAYIDDKLNEYSAILASEDNDLTAEKKQEINAKIDKHKQYKNKYEAYKKQLDETGQVQISTSDPDSRQMIVRNNITEVAYNVQSTVDAKHNIPIDFKVTNKNDSKAMGAMARRAKTILGKSDFTILFDKGYHTGTEFDYAHKQGVEVLVAFPDVASHAPDISFDVEHFNYNKERDEYTCPAGELLTTNGRWYNKASGKTINRVKHYKTKACLTCSLFEKCTRNKTGRFIERSEHMDLIDANKKRLQRNMETYRKRQAIVEHPFGVIKRQWDFYYVMTKKTMKHATADVGLIFTCYNLRRIFNLLDQNTLKNFLRELGFLFLILSSHFKTICEDFKERIYSETFCETSYTALLKQVYLSKKQIV